MLYLITTANNKSVLELCIESGIGQREGCGGREESEGLSPGHLRMLAPGAPPPLGSVWPSSDLRLSFLSGKQMFLLSFSNSRVYF